MLEDIIIPKIIIDRFTSLMNLDYEDLIKVHIDVKLNGDDYTAQLHNDSDIDEVVEALDLYFDQDNCDMTKAYNDYVVYTFRVETTIQYFFEKMLETLSDDERSMMLSEFIAFSSIVRTIIEDRVPLHDDHKRMARAIIMAASAYDIAREIWLEVEDKLKTIEPSILSMYKMYQALLDTNMRKSCGKDVVELCIATFIQDTICTNMVINTFEDPLTEEESNELLRINNKIMSIANQLTDSNADNDDVEAFANIIDKYDAYITEIMHKYSKVE